MEIPQFWCWNLAIKKTIRKNIFLKQKQSLVFLCREGFMPKIISYQTTPVWLSKNEYLKVKINVYCSVPPSDRVIGWDMKMTSHPNSNASFINIQDSLIWRWLPNLTRSSKLVAALNCCSDSLGMIGYNCTCKIASNSQTGPSRVKCYDLLYIAIVTLPECQVWLTNQIFL